MKNFVPVTFLMVACFFTDKVFSQNTFPSTGNVGIGTTSPTGLLDVRGDAFINGMSVGISSSLDTLTTVVGRKALQFPAGATGNTAIGSYAMQNTWGSQNIAIGIASLINGNGSSNNTAVGNNTLGYGYFSGNDNTVVGSGVMGGLTESGNQNTAVGAGAMFSVIHGGEDNVAMGYRAFGGSGFYTSQPASRNVPIGSYSQYLGESGKDNCAIGHRSLYSNTGGHMNTVNGSNAMPNSYYGGYNTSLGAYTLYNNYQGNFNTASGYSALYQTTGHLNTGVGTYALYFNTSGAYNTSIGYFATPNSGSLSNTTALGYNATTTASNQVRIGSNTVTSIGGYTGWTNISDGRVKRNLQENVPGLSFINLLRPVTSHLDIEQADHITGASRREKNDKITMSEEEKRDILTAIKEKEKQVYTGFIAQEVAKAAAATGYDFSGVDVPKNSNDLYGLRYAEFVVPLVKAVQELSQQNEKLSQQNADLQKEMAELKLLLLQQGDHKTQTIALSGASIEQNIPNPFESATTITYVLPSRYSSTAIVFTNAAGKTIKTVKLTGSGKASIVLQSAELNSGVYQYSLIIDDRLVQT